MDELLKNLTEQDLVSITLRDKDGKLIGFRRSGDGYIVSGNDKDIVRLERTATGFKATAIDEQVRSRGSWECYEACINSCGPSLGCAKLCGEKCGIS